MPAASIGGLTYNIGLDLSKLVKGMAKQETLMKNMVSKLEKTVKKGVDAVNKGGEKTKDKNSFLSPQWFASRVRWFVQLRAFWALWQTLKKSIAGAFEFEQEMANVRAITQSTIVQFEELRQKALEVGRTTRFSAAEAAKGMVVMSQAGLSVEEILSSIDHVANLATGTMFDFKETASLMVTVMRAWSMEADKAQEITDTLATAINTTKLNMESLRVGFNFIAGIAPQLNLSLKETTALLGTLANRGLSASTAATSLRSVMAALLKPTDRFKKVLKDIGLTANEVDPRFNEMTTILKKLKGAGFGAAEAFMAFRRRAAAGASILIKAAGEVEDLSNGLVEIGRASQMAEDQLATTSGQAKQFNDAMIAVTATIIKDLQPSIMSIIKGTKLLATSIIKTLRPVAKLIGTIVKGYQLIGTVLTQGSKGLAQSDFAQDMRELNDRSRDFGDRMRELVNDGNRLNDAFSKMKNEAEGALDAERAGMVTDEMKRAVKIALAAGLLTKDEAKEIRSLTTLQEKYARLMESSVSRRIHLLNMLSNEYGTLKTNQEVTDKVATEAAVNRAREQYNELKAAEREENRARNRLELLKQTQKNQKERGLAPTVFEGNFIAQERKITDIQKNSTKAFARLFDTIRKSGPKVKAIIGELGEDTEQLFRAMQLAPSGKPEEVAGILAQIQRVEGKSLRITKKQLDQFEDMLDPLAEMRKKHRVTNDDLLKQLESEKAIKQVMIKVNKENLKELQQKEKTEEIVAKQTMLVGTNLTLKQRIVDIDKAIIRIQDEENIGKLKALDLSKRINESEAKRLINAVSRKGLDQLEKDLRYEEELRLIVMKKQNSIAELIGIKDTEKLKNGKAILEEQKRSAEQELLIEQSAREGVQSREKIRDLTKEIANLESSIAVNILEQNMALDAVARKKAKSAADPLNVDTWKEFMNAEGAVLDTLFSAGEGAGEVAVTDIANLWAEQTEEAAALSVELENLNKQYQQALSEGNLNRAKELEETMSNMRQKIDDLNSPLKNLANTFKEFALSVIKELQKVIIKMLIIKLLQTVFGGVSGGGGGAVSSVGGSVGSDLGSSSFGYADGGVVPGGTFGNFRKFAKGGVTGGAGLAMLGDNPSGKELVIPSENIKDDEVSGYTRDGGKTPINIVNIVTEQDIAKAMSGLEGQKVIVNTIGADIGKRGPTYRALRS